MGVHRIALVGPSSAFPGGIAQHTAELASRLDEARLLVEHASWGRQFPRSLRPGRQRAVGSGERPIGESGRAQVSHDLHWDRPSSWLRTGRRLRHVADRLVIVVSSPLQLPAVRVLATSFRETARSDPARRDVLLVVHDVLPHERARFDQLLMRRVLGTADQIVVHSGTEEQVARELGARVVKPVRLPFHPPEGLRSGPHPAGGRRLHALGFIGFVRPYKGLDILLEALALTKSQPRLVVQGEFWEPIKQYQRLIASLALIERVDLRPGYASGSEISETFGQIDALVLPYRSATGTQQPQLAFMHGVPIIASAAASFASGVQHGRDGILITDLTAESVAQAIDEFYRNGLWHTLRSQVRPPSADEDWDRYLAAVSGR